VRCRNGFKHLRQVEQGIFQSFAEPSAHSTLQKIIKYAKNKEKPFSNCHFSADFGTRSFTITNFSHAHHSFYLEVA